MLFVCYDRNQRFFAFHVVSTHQVDAACVVKVDCVITMRSMKVSLL